MKIEKGRVYKVKEDDIGVFEPGDLVVALENDSAPNCVRTKDFNGSMYQENYGSKVCSPLWYFELEEYLENGKPVYAKEGKPCSIK